METKTMGPRNLDFVLSEASGTRSYESVTIASGAGVLKAGTVLGKISRGAITVAKTDIGGGKGLLTLGDPAHGASVTAGIYKVIITAAEADGGAFSVEGPDGVTIGTGAVGAEFNGAVVFSLADGGTDFAVGDTALVTVTVADGSGKFVPSPDTETSGWEGAETAEAVLAYDVDATSGDVEALIFRRDGEVKTKMLVFDASVDDATKTGAKLTQLAAANIHAR